MDWARQAQKGNKNREGKDKVLLPKCLLRRNERVTIPANGKRDRPTSSPERLPESGPARGKSDIPNEGGKKGVRRQHRRAGVTSGESRGGGKEGSCIQVHSELTPGTNAPQQIRVNDLGKGSKRRRGGGGLFATMGRGEGCDRNVGKCEDDGG